MKKTMIVLAAVITITSCGGNENKPAATTTEGPKPAATTEQAMSPEAQKGLDLIAGSDCLGCHKIEERLQGPGYREIAQKYKGQETAMKDTLAQRIIKGHVGVWGDIQMTPHPTLSEADAKAMVAYVLSLNQQ